jgi:hypothetical protein
VHGEMNCSKLPERPIPISNDKNKGIKIKG